MILVRKERLAFFSFVCSDASWAVSWSYGSTRVLLDSPFGLAIELVEIERNSPEEETGQQR